MQNSPRAKKAARTRAKNARIRAANAEVRSAAALSEKSLIEKRAKAYGEMESRVCDLARGASLAMAVFEDPELFLFAVGQLDAMTERFGLRYYAAEFPPE
jgi:hypothetical protein